MEYQEFHNSAFYEGENEYILVSDGWIYILYITFDEGWVLHSYQHNHRTTEASYKIGRKIS